MGVVNWIGNAIATYTGGEVLSPPESGLVNRYISDVGITLNGGDVSQWDDQVGSLNLTAAAQSNEPVYNSGNQINGHPSVDFDGTNHYIQNTTFNLSQPSTEVLIYKNKSIEDPVTNQIYLGSNQSGAYNNLYILAGGSGAAPHYALAGATGEISKYSHKIWQYEMMEWNGASSKYYLNGKNVDTSVNTNTQAHNDLVIGASGNGGSQAALEVAELLIYNKVLSAGEITELNNYIDQRYNLIETTTTGTFSFTNSLNSTSYDARYSYPTNRGVDLPVIVLGYGVGGSELTFVDAVLDRIAGYGFFVINADFGQLIPGDVGGDLSHSIIDSLDYVTTNFSSVVSSTKASFIGYSAGGGLSLCAASRWPDRFGVVADYFGASDYGFDGTNSWYFTNIQWQDEMDAQIGTPRANFLDEYQARKMRDVIGKNFKGELFIFHQDPDTLVDLTQSSLLKTQLDTDGFVDYTYTVNDFYSHGIPTSSALIYTEGNWAIPALSATKPVMPDSGVVRVAGFITTSKFEIILNNNAFNAVVDVTYDVTANTYTCTPVSPTTPINVSIVQGAKSGSSNISSETLITVT